MHQLEAEVDASQTLVREVCAEREELRKMLDNKQNEISAEDQEVMNEMQMLLGEFETHNSEGGDVPQKSSFELLKQCAGVLEKNVERLAQRAEVCPFFHTLVFVQDTNLPGRAVYSATERAYQVAPGKHEELRGEPGRRYSQRARGESFLYFDHDCMLTRSPARATKSHRRPSSGARPGQLGLVSSPEQVAEQQHDRFSLPTRSWLE